MPGADENHTTAGAGPARAAARWERARWCLSWALLVLAVVLAAAVALSITAGMSPEWGRMSEVVHGRVLWPVLIACELVALAHISTSVGLRRSLRRSQRRNQRPPTA